MDQQEAVQQSLLERGREIAIRGALALGILGSAATAVEIAMPSEAAFADYECPYELPDYWIEKTDPVTGAVSSIQMCYGDKPTTTTKPHVTNPPATNPPTTKPPVTIKPITTTAATTTLPTTTTTVPSTTEAPTTTEQVTTTTDKLEPTTTTYATVTTQEKPVEPAVEAAKDKTPSHSTAILAGSLIVALAGATGGRKLLAGFRRRKKD